MLSGLAGGFPGRGFFRPDSAPASTPLFSFWPWIAQATITAYRCRSLHFTPECIFGPFIYPSCCYLLMDALILFIPILSILNGTKHLILLLLITATLSPFLGNMIKYAHET
jgi:hypothetical protein